MSRWLLITFTILSVLVSGCTLPRSADSAGDIAEFVPPPPEEVTPVSPAAEAETTAPPEATQAVQLVETAQAAGDVVQADTVIRFQPDTQQLNVGDSSNVEIWIENAVDLIAVDVQVSFDPNVLQVVDFDPGQEGLQIQLGNFVQPDFVIENEADNLTGQISISFAQLSPAAPANGGGWLATIPFQAVGQGISQLTFPVAQLATGDGQLLAVTTQPGQVVVVVGDGSPTPVVTPSPTFTLVPGQPTPTPTATLLPGVDTPTPTPTSTPLPLPPATPTVTPLPVPTSTPVPLADLPVIKLPPNPTFGFCYRVQRGDTLSNLGQKFGVDPGFINLANDLYPPGHIFLHQALFIPQTYGSGPNVYRVQFGDTLAQIADDCHLPVDFLAQVNGLEVTDPLVLQAGERVRLEDGTTIVLEEAMIRIEILLIPIPPFPPPSRYHYPGSVFPPVAPGPPPQPPLPPPPPPPQPCNPPYCGY